MATTTKGPTEAAGIADPFAWARAGDVCLAYGHVAYPVKRLRQLVKNGATRLDVCERAGGRIIGTLHAQHGGTWSYVSSKAAAS